MKFLISRDQLLLPLQQIVSVIEKRQTLPILANVLLQVNDEFLIITGTDTEIQIIAKLALEHEHQLGNITVPARKFLDICRLLPTGAVLNFELLQDKVKLSSARSRFSLSTLPADFFPEFNEQDYENQFLIDAAKLKNAFDKTLFCMASQDVRYYLNGVLLHISNSKIKFVASDGHRLAVYDNELDPTGFEARIILPRKAVQELSRIIDDTDTCLSVQFSSNNLRVFYKNIVFSSKLIDAKFPDFSKAFNQEFMPEIITHKQLLKDALSRVAILSNEKYRGITLDINNDHLKLSTHNPEHEEAEEELLIQYSGEPLRISFNAQYLMDAVANLDSDMARLTIASNASTCFIEEGEHSIFKFIVMPMLM